LPNNYAQLEISPNRIILEPIGRNTAPATALAALTALDYDTIHYYSSSLPIISSPMHTLSVMPSLLVFHSPKLII
jgi:mannose-1-phosphate guanylyltransferase